MPTFEITAPDGRKFRVTGPEGATQEQALAQIQAQYQPESQTQTQPPPTRSLGEEALRQVGLGTRALVQGAASLPGIFIDPFQRIARRFESPSLTDLIVQKKPSPTMTEATSNILDRLGLPKPETTAEKISSAMSSGLTAGGGSALLAKAIPMLLKASPEVINNILAQAPLTQAIQGGVGAGAAEGVRQAGGSDIAALAASAIAPLGVNATQATARAVGRGAREIIRPVTEAGAKQIAADVLGSVASDKARAIRNLDDYLAAQKAGTIGVPGSKPTAGAVSADYGLIGGEQLAARGPANPYFAERLAANNEARLAELAKLRATEEQVAAYKQRREDITTPLRETALGAGTGGLPGYQVTAGVDFSPVVERIMRLTATPEGGRAESQKALTWITERIGKYLEEGRIDPRNAYELHKDIGDLVKGRIQSDKGALRLSAGLANDVKRTLSAQIEQAAPGFEKYLETYARLSRPIDRLEAITSRLGAADLARVTNATPQVGREGASFPLSQAKVRQATMDLAKLPEQPGGLPLAPYQSDVLSRVAGDLNAEALALRGGKMPGSDTYQNMATANLLSGIFGQRLAEAGLPKVVSAPLNLAYKPLEKRIRNLVDEAYLDPKKMAELLKIARTKRGSASLADILTTSNQNIYGGLLGGTAVNE